MGGGNDEMGRIADTPYYYEKDESLYIIYRKYAHYLKIPPAHSWVIQRLWQSSRGKCPYISYYCPVQKRGTHDKCPALSDLPVSEECPTPPADGWETPTSSMDYWNRKFGRDTP